jgi:hypothetical protein
MPQLLELTDEEFFKLLGKPTGRVLSAMHDGKITLIRWDAEPRPPEPEPEPIADPLSEELDG